MTDRQAPPTTDAPDHAFRARLAMRGLLVAKKARDADLAARYARLVEAHLSRHLEQRRRVVP